MSDDEDLFRFTRRLTLQRKEGVQPLRWRPAADVYRHASGWLIKLELAGVAPEQVEVIARGRHLIIRGRRRDATLARGYACYAMEIVYSEFERVLELPVELDRAELLTRYRDGMLLVNLDMEHERS
jgi:HSP20 family protein